VNTTPDSSAPDREHVPLPPLVYGAGVLAGLAIDWLVSVRLLSADVQVWLGGPLVMLAFVLVLMAAWELKRRNTSPFHHHPTTALVPHGLYAYSRNPIYVAMTIGCVGLAVAIDRAWILAGTALATVVIDRVVIAREEAFLTAKFGDAYRDYTARVRRWL
jgi:protein-S-isoprenylcysteine O-methyltransferase Ste14